MFSMSQGGLTVKSKILMVILGGSIVYFLSLGIILLFYMEILGAEIERSSGDLEESTAQDSEETLKNQAKEHLQRLASSQAAYSGVVFAKVESEVNLLAGWAGHVWSSSMARMGPSYTSLEKPPQADQFPVIRVAPGVSQEAIQDEIDISSNMDPLMKLVSEKSPILYSLHMGTARGLHRRFPWTEKRKESYDPRERSWYQQAVASRKLGWTEPFISHSDEILMVTCVKAVLGRDNEVVGVIGADVTLSSISSLIIGTQLGQSGYSLLLDRKGSVITRPNMDKSDMRWDETFETENLLRSENVQLREIAHKMVSGEPGGSVCTLDGEEKYVAYAPIPATRWSLAIVMPIREIIRPALAVKAKIASRTQRTKDYIARQVVEINLVVISFFSIFVIGVVLVSVNLARKVTDPLRIVADAAEAIAEGDLARARRAVEEGMPPGFQRAIQNRLAQEDGGASRSKNEILRLVEAISTMISSLESLLSQMRQSSNQVYDSAAKISTSARYLEATAAEQAASSNIVKASTLSISATAEDLAHSMDGISKMISQAAELSHGGISSLFDIQTIMQELLKNTLEILDKLRVIEGRANEITEVFITITKIANDTNLLSLNALIESEKAGKYGVGFSVVSQEIRRLADQTCAAALDIEKMILSMQREMKGGVADVERHTEQARTASGKIEGIIEDLRTAILHIGNLGPEFEAVNQVTQKQSQSARQITMSMEELNSAAGHAKDSLVEFNKVTGQLVQSVEGLRSEMERYGA